jgi:hypothetical protein
LNLTTLNFACFTPFHPAVYQHFTSFDPLSQISAPRHLILQVRAIQTKDQATRNGGVHLEEQEEQARQKVAGTAQEDRKNGKSSKAAAATNFPLLLYAAARMPQKVYKRRGPGSLPPYHTSHLASISNPSHVHHSTNTFLLHNPAPNFSTFFLYSSIATRLDPWRPPRTPPRTPP